MEKKEKKVLLEVNPKQKGSSSSASMFCTLIGVLTIIGGFIISISAGKSSSYASFNWQVFFINFFTYAIAGCFMFCMAELLQNIFSIAKSLRGYEVIGEEKISEPISKVQETEDNKDSSVSESIEQESKEQVDSPNNTIVNESKAGKEECHVTPIPCENRKEVKCPICGTIQNKNRRFCFHCSAKFE